MTTKRDKFRDWKKTGRAQEIKKSEEELYNYWLKKFRNNYNKPEKNEIRDNLIHYAQQYKVKSILTLESYQYLFSKKLPECKIIVFENDKENYRDMKKNKPKNVRLFFGDIIQSADLNIKTNFVYLDFCRTWFKEKEKVYILKEIISNSKLFALTLCLHDTMTKIGGDWQFYLVNQLQEILGNLKVVYGKTYGKGRSTMITILFEIIK